MTVATKSFLIMVGSGISAYLIESSIEEEKGKMASFLVSCINTNWHGELRCPLVVRVPFILGTDLTASKGFHSVVPQIFSNACYVSGMELSVEDT